MWLAIGWQRAFPDHFRIPEEAAALIYSIDTERALINIPEKQIRQTGVLRPVSLFS